MSPWRRQLLSYYIESVSWVEIVCWSFIWSVIAGVEAWFRFFRRRR